MTCPLWVGTLLTAKASLLEGAGVSMDLVVVGADLGNDPGHGNEDADVDLHEGTGGPVRAGAAPPWPGRGHRPAGPRKPAFWGLMPVLWRKDSKTRHCWSPGGKGGALGQTLHSAPARRATLGHSHTSSEPHLMRNSSGARSAS